ncbi:hypothetical protein ASF60_18130 [Methylobacterium sp. Leaf113]|uniref:hypothetical protein n=1 Tax=Methylobacterium sp. Leaf113 TaxID=1736259 RepID=UPI0006FEDA80|nr:hypothetical protein [Methylobacterium sp. Leaf113]KQP91362.1 hypothetical protein ASF60_18130 [Methylobacterium sp. Leaf113]
MTKSQIFTTAWIKARSKAQTSGLTAKAIFPAALREVYASLRAEQGHTGMGLYRAGDLNGAATHFAHEYQGMAYWEAADAAEYTAWLAATRDTRFYAAVESAQDDLRFYATAA